MAPSSTPLLHHPQTPSPLLHHLIATTSEFLGTTLFLFFALGGAHVANTLPLSADAQRLTTSSLLYIALAFGLSLATNVWAFFRIGGGMFNPAVAVAMLIAQAIDVTRFVLVVVAQLAGGVAAAALVRGLLGAPLAVVTELAPGVGVARGLFIEVVLTAELVFVIFMLATEKHRATAVAPVGIGLALFIAHLIGVPYTGSGLNPARSFGPAVVSARFPGHHWIYWMGPVLGAMLATGFYQIVKLVGFDSISPGIDEPARYNADVAQNHRVVNGEVEAAPDVERGAA